MQFKNIALLALSSTAAAEFVIITSTPIPTDIAGALAHPTSYASSLRNFLETKLSSVSTGSAVSAAVSAHRGLESFAATATQFDIPSGVTKLGAIETFGSTPAWYSALPSDVKSYYDEYNKEVNSVLVEAIGGKPAANTTSGGGSATGSAGAAGATGTTGAAADRIVGVMGAGIAAAFAGVMAL